MVTCSLDFGFSLVDAGNNLGEDAAEYIATFGISRLRVDWDGNSGVEDELSIDQ